VEATGVPLVLVAFVQHSSVLDRTRESNIGPSALVARGTATGGGGRAATLPCGVRAQPHVSSCGHALHERCWRKYVDNVLDKENRRSELMFIDGYE
jgi:hypothetical protein